MTSDYFLKRLPQRRRNWVDANRTAENSAELFCQILSHTKEKKEVGVMG